MLTSRFHLGPPLKELGPSLMATGFGMIFGLARLARRAVGRYRLARRRRAASAVHEDVFLKRLDGWVDSLQPRDPRAADPARYRLDDLAGTEGSPGLPTSSARSCARTAARRDVRMDHRRRVPVLPVHERDRCAVRARRARRVRRDQVALEAGRPRQDRRRRRVARDRRVGYIWLSGRESSNWANPDSGWIDQPTRTALAATNAIVENTPEDSPIVFIVNFGDTYQAYGWSKTFTNVSRTGCPATR